MFSYFFVDFEKKSFWGNFYLILSIHKSYLGLCEPVRFSRFHVYRLQRNKQTSKYIYRWVETLENNAQVLLQDYLLFSIHFKSIENLFVETVSASILNGYKATSGFNLSWKHHNVSKFKNSFCFEPKPEHKLNSFLTGFIWLFVWC